MTSFVQFAPLLLALATVALATPTPQPPNGIRQCARSECPVYTELENYGSDLYKRRVEPGVWVSKVSPTCNRTEAVDLVYMSLHNYFESNNITRTTPILMEVNKNKARSNLCPDQSLQFPCCRNLYSLAFFIPSASQQTAPKPTPESGVHLVNASDPRDFYVTVFSGRATMVNVARELTELHSYLIDQDLPYNEDDYAIASYDAPWRPLPHRSEVWVAVESGRHRGRGGDNEKGNGNRGGDREDGRRGDRGDSRHRRSLDDDVDLLPF